MTDQRKKTPHEIVSDLLEQWLTPEVRKNGGTLYAAMFKEFEQAIQAERDQYEGLRRAFDQAVETDNDLLEENSRMREALKETDCNCGGEADYSDQSYVSQDCVRCKALTQTPENDTAFLMRIGRENKIREAERAVVEAARYLDSVLAADTDETKLVLAAHKLELALEKLDQLQKEPEK